MPALAVSVCVGWIGVWLAGTLAATAAFWRGRLRWFVSGAFASLAYVQAVLTLLLAGQLGTMPYWIPLLASGIGLLTAPCFYLAVRGLLDPSQGYRFWDAAHFIPALVQLCIQLPVVTAGPMRQALFEDYAMIGLLRSFVPGVEVPRVLMVVYAGLIGWQVVRARRSQQAAPLGYALAATYAGLSIAMVLVFSASPHAWVRPVAVTALLAGLHAVLLARPMLLAGMMAKRAKPTTVLPAGDGMLGLEPAMRPLSAADASPGPTTARYESSSLTDARKAVYRRQLLAFMEDEQAYLNPALTVADAGERLGVLPRYVSQVVNETLGVGFADFVNSYRVQAAKQWLGDPSNDHLTVLAIGEEVGFRSKSAFYTAFKKETGHTPAFYRSQPRPA